MEEFQQSGWGNIFMKLWQKLALENDLLDIYAWLSHACSCGVFDCQESALESKSEACAKRMLGVCLNHPLPEDFEEQVILKAGSPSYKNRQQREAESEAQRAVLASKAKKAQEDEEKNRKAALRAEILQMKKEGLI